MNTTETTTPKPFGFDERLQHSLDLLRKGAALAKRYDPIDGYFLAFSGGKDSQALYHLAEMAQVPFRAHFNLTSVDPPQVIRFVKTHYPSVELIAPKESIYSIAKRKNCPPTMRLRWCCAEFKEMAGAGKVTLIGIRRSESQRRAKRNECEIGGSKAFSGTFEDLDEYRKKVQASPQKRRHLISFGVHNAEEIDQESQMGCITAKESLLVSPLLKWSEEDVWYFLNEVVKVEHCSLYDSGYERIGCIMCPMANRTNTLRDIAHFPHAYHKWMDVFGTIQSDRDSWQWLSKVLFSKCCEELNETERTELARWQFDWWISKKPFAEWSWQFREQSLFGDKPIAPKWEDYKREYERKQI